LKNGQIAIEFMSMMVIGIFMSMVMMVAFLVFMQDANADRKSAQIEDFGFKLQREIMLASEVHRGYERELNLPTQINGKYNYEVNNTNRLLLVSYDNTDLTYPIPEVSGTLEKGYNLLKNVGGHLVVIQ